MRLGLKTCRLGLPVFLLAAPSWSQDLEFRSAPAAPKVEPAGGEGKQVVAPRLRVEPKVAYPEGQTEVAVVVLRLQVGRTGAVEKAEVVSGIEPFASEAARAALGFEFDPALEGGEARASLIQFAIEFHPPEEPAPPQPPQSAPLASAERGAVVSAEPAAAEPVEVSVAGRRKPGSTRLMTDEEARIIPGAEGDPIRAVQVLPGTVPTLMSGPFIGIRGAPPGMVGSWYDGIELPYLFHLARGTAVVHPWLVESAALYAAGAPSRLGNSPGGYIEATAAPPEGRLRLSGRVRLTETALGAEIPFAGGRGSMMAAGRYSYTEPLVSLIAPEFALDYWDYQSRVGYDLDRGKRIEAIAFGSGDVTGRRAPNGSIEEIFNASFHRAALRYTHHSARGMDRVGLVYGYDRWDANQSQFKPQNHSLTTQLSSARTVGKSGAVVWGGSASVRFQEDQYLAATQAITTFSRTDEQVGLWLDYEWTPTSRTSITLGVRGDLYSSGTSPISAAALDVGVGPRFLLSHQASRHVRLHNSFGYHSAPPSTGQRPPGRTFPITGGLTQAFLSDAGVEFTLPAALKLDLTLYHNIYFDTGDVNTLSNLQGQLRAVYEAPTIARGQGQSTGFEVSLRRTLFGPIQGFLSYSLSRSVRTVGVVSGYAEFDRTHVVDAALGYNPGKDWLISLRGSAFSGYPARVSSVELAANPPRTAPYYQIDAQISKRWKLSRPGTWWGVTVGILNATLQQETNDMYCTPERCKVSMVGPATIPTLGVEGEL